MRVVVTGGAGLIGSGLTNLLKERAEVVILDIKKPTQNDVEWIQGDIQGFDAHIRDLGDFDGIIHLAAVSRVIDAENDPLETWKINVGGTLKILETIRDKGPWVVYGSSREVYGEPEEFPVDENTIRKPINVYGVTKLACERLVAEYAKNRGTKAAILRFSNVYGGFNDHKTRVIPLFINRALKGEPLILNGRFNTFDFKHIDDTVTGILKAVDWVEQAEAGICEDFNICTGKATSLERLAELIIEYTESPSELKDNIRRDYDVNNFCGSWAKAKRLLDYSPSISIEEGLKRVIPIVRKWKNKDAPTKQIEVPKRQRRIND